MANRAAVAKRGTRADAVTNRRADAVTRGQHKRADGNMASWSVIQCFGTFASGRSYSKELRQVSYEGGIPNYDIRMWKVDNHGNEYPCKGVSLDYHELKRLYDILKEIFE